MIKKPEIINKQPQSGSPKTPPGTFFNIFNNDAVRLEVLPISLEAKIWNQMRRNGGAQWMAPHYQTKNNKNDNIHKEQSSKNQI